MSLFFIELFLIYYNNCVTPQFRQKKEKNSPIFPKNAEPNKKRKVKFSGRKIKLEKTSLIYSPKKEKRNSN